MYSSVWPPIRMSPCGLMRGSAQAARPPRGRRHVGAAVAKPGVKRVVPRRPERADVLQARDLELLGLAQDDFAREALDQTRRLSRQGPSGSLDSALLEVDATSRRGLSARRRAARPALTMDAR